MVAQSKLNSRHQSTFCIVVLNPPFRRYGLPKAICHLFLWAGKVVAGMATFFFTIPAPLQPKFWGRKSWGRKKWGRIDWHSGGMLKSKMVFV
jgi:hypothetical protein